MCSVVDVKQRVLSAVQPLALVAKVSCPAQSTATVMSVQTRNWSDSTEEDDKIIDKID